MSYKSSSRSSSYGYSSYGSDESSSDDSYELFETIRQLPSGIHIVYNPHATSTFTKTKRYVPKTFQNLKVFVHDPRTTYKSIDGEDLWGMACSSLQNTNHTTMDEEGNVEMVHTCDPAMSGDFFEKDKLDSTTNMILLNITNDEEGTKKMKTFILCRDLHEQTLRKMRTKQRQQMYEYNGDFNDYMKMSSEPCLYVEGLCSKEKGVGRLMMNLLDVIVERSAEYKAIKLAALTYVVKYYYKLGFRFSNSPDPNFPKNINDPSLFEKVNKMVDMLPKITSDEEYQKKEIIDFVNVIQPYKLFNTDFDTRINKRQVKRLKRRISYYYPITDTFVKRSPGYRQKQATIAHNLGENGWYMYKIFDKPLKSVPRRIRYKTPTRKTRKRVMSRNSASKSNRKTKKTKMLSKSKSKTRRSKSKK
jgi:hypothetical protein